MATIIQPHMFSWKDIEADSDLNRLRLVLSVLPDEDFVCLLEQLRGRGRDDYPIRPTWNAMLAGIVFLCLRLFGCFSDSEEAQADETGRKGATTAVTGGAVGESTTQTEPAESEEGLEEIEAAVADLAGGATPTNLDRVRELAESAGSGRAGDLARAVVSAAGSDPVGRWHGLSRLYADVWLDAAIRSALIR